MRLAAVRFAGALFLLAVPFVSHAHLLGQSFETRVGEYLLDAGCDAVQFNPNKQTYCSFALITNPDSFDWEIAPYDSVVVGIRSKDTNESILDQNTPSTPGTSTFMVVTFPRAGEYVMRVGFTATGSELASAEFPLTVYTELGMFAPSRIIGILGLVATAGIACALGIATFKVRPKK